MRQADIQAALRTATGKALNYNGDWHARFDADGIPAGDFNGRLLRWINETLGTAYTGLPGAWKAWIDAGATQPDAMPSWYLTGNLFTAADDLSTAAWTLTNVTVAADAVASPFAEAADRMLETTATGNHQVQQSVPFDGASDYQTRCIVQSIGGRNLFMTFPAAAFTTARTARFDLTAGTATAVAGVSTLEIDDLGDGWWDCRMTATASVEATAACAFRALDGTTSSYAGDAAKGLLFALVSVRAV